MNKVIFVLVLVIVLLVYLLQRSVSTNTISRAHVINLDQNTERLTIVKKQYVATDIAVPLERFSAILGADVNLQNWLTAETISELTEIEEQGFRTKHHHLTRGAIGCYLSHMELLKQIKPGEMHLILEDDIFINPKSTLVLKNILATAPSDWDFILLGYNSNKNVPYSDTLVKIKSFWGTCGYLVTYKGAQKFLRATGDTFDCQIDTFISWMAAHGQLDIYALKTPLLRPHNKFESDIQYPIKVTGPESFLYRDKILQLY